MICCCPSCARAVKSKWHSLHSNSKVLRNKERVSSPSLFKSIQLHSLGFSGAYLKRTMKLLSWDAKKWKVKLSLSTRATQKSPLSGGDTWCGAISSVIFLLLLTRNSVHFRDPSWPALWLLLPEQEGLCAVGHCPLYSTHRYSLCVQGKAYILYISETDMNVLLEMRDFDA